MRCFHTVLFSLLIYSVLYSVPAIARTWHISPDGSGDAATIQAGIDSAEVGDDVLLAAGTYTWTSQAPSGTSMVRMKSGVSLHSQAGANATILDAELIGRVILCQDVGDVRIEGITLQRGSAQDIGLGGGGLLAIGDSRPTIVGCNFRNNAAIRDFPLGGAIYCDVATIRDCELVDNAVVHGGGGAVWCGDALIENSVFRGNMAGGDAAGGGAIAAASATIRGCVFERNAATAFVSARGGAIGGGALIESCVFVNNKADSFTECGSGGAVLTVDATVRDCVFIGNEVLGPSTNEGGAIKMTGEGLIENCTILGSSGGNSNSVAGIWTDDAATISHVILGTSTTGMACGGPGNPTWVCCDVYGNASGNALCGTDGGGNFSGDPQFCAVDPEASLNVALQEDSPCAPGMNPGGTPCGLIGAGQIGCGALAVERNTWSKLKSFYR